MDPDQAGSPNGERRPVGPLDPSVVPRYAGPSTFARLPAGEQVGQADVAVLGIPFDSGTSYRPGARFGPAAVRAASRALRTAYHPPHDIEPFAKLQVADAGDVPANPFSISEALEQIEDVWSKQLGTGATVLGVGGDHTVTLAALRAVHRHLGPVSLIHFDAHLDTWDTYFGAPYTHGTFLRRAAEERLFADDASVHVGIRGPLYDRRDLARDAELGFRVVHCDEFQRAGLDGIVERIRQRIGDRPLYVSVDIDVLDPSHAPGTGTPEVGGMTTRELLNVLRGLSGLRLVGGDVVEVSPPFDHAELTSLAAATVAYELLALVVLQRTAVPVSEGS
jgi:agmatinase